MRGPAAWTPGPDHPGETLTGYLARVSLAPKPDEPATVAERADDLALQIVEAIQLEADMTIEDVLTAMSRHPQIAQAMERLVGGCQIADARDHDFVLQHLEVFAGRFGAPTTLR